MTYDLATFFTYIRRTPFNGRISQTQKEGIDSILSAWKTTGIEDSRQLAYILATVYHETAATMQPVREGLAKSDASARRILSKYRYSKPDQVSKGVNNLPKLGHAYYGRGYIQITWADNYHRLGERLGIALHANPDLALQCDVAARILVVGMVEGLFTGRRLSQYFNKKANNPVAARAIVNGTDKASLIATYHSLFLGALEAADTTTPLPQNIKEDAAKADGNPLIKDTTILGGITSIAGSGAVGALGAINNPWALAAFVVVAVGLWLLITGRIEIKRKVGV